MLQQTQVARVVERFDRFIARFPTVASLAAATEHDVLAMWAGLGYYRRARNLHKAAKALMEHHAGAIPNDVIALRRLPGVGRYTAGAIASIAGGQRTPLVDGNVVRVLLRVAGREGSASEKDTMKWAWQRASELVERAGDAGVFNEAMMELGATICTPGMPACESCPLQEICRARQLGRQTEIPSPKKSKAKQQVYCAAIVVIDAQGRVFMEQRGDTGMWSSMWQAPTLETHDAPATARDVKKWLKEQIEAAPTPAVKRVASFVHQTTHRELIFDVWRACVKERPGRSSDAGKWLQPSEVIEMPISNAQRRVLSLGLIDSPERPSATKKPLRRKQKDAGVMKPKDQRKRQTRLSTNATKRDGNATRR